MTGKRAGDELAFPLAWPDGHPRTEPHMRQRARFKVTAGRARDDLVEELRRLGARYIVISTDVPLRRDGLPYAGGDPEDTGVAVYFDLDGEQHVLPCDRWNTVGDNLQALAKTVEAMRGIERWGTGGMMRRAFSAFKALPAAPREWWHVLGVSRVSSLAVVKDRYRELAREAHPDTPTGSHEQMSRLNAAMAAAEQELSS